MKKIIFIIVFLISIFILSPSDEIKYPLISIEIEKQDNKITVYQDDTVIWEVEPQQEDYKTYYKVLNDIYLEAFNNKYAKSEVGSVT